MLFVDDLELCGEPEENLWARTGSFGEVCERKRLKENADNVKWWKDRCGQIVWVRNNRSMFESSSNWSLCWITGSGI